MRVFTSLQRAEVASRVSGSPRAGEETRAGPSVSPPKGGVPPAGDLAERPQASIIMPTSTGILEASQ